MDSHPFGEKREALPFHQFSNGRKAEQYVKSFANGFSTSVICHEGSYGGKEGLYELMLEYRGLPTSEDDITAPGDSVCGWLTKEEVLEKLKKVKMLSPKPKDKPIFEFINGLTSDSSAFYGEM